MRRRKRTGEVGVIYLLCIEPPLHHARHYAGWAKGADPASRVEEHMRGQGSPLVKAALAAGRAVTLVFSKPGTRDDERAMKNRKNLRQFCPRCTPNYRIEKRAAAERRRDRRANDEQTRAEGHPASVGGDGMHDPDAGHAPDGDPRP